MTTIPETTTPVPFLDLSTAHADLRAELLEAFGQVIDSSAFINGAPVREFEEQWAAWCGVEHCVGLASGLDALRLALTVAGVGPGDEVLVPAMTFIATWEAVTQVGAVPCAVDVSESDYGLDPAAAAAAITERTGAIMPVHLYGHCADLAALEPLAATRGLALIEDAAQAHGAARDGRRAGGGDNLAAFSFYPGKNLGAMGDAGALVTNDEVVAARVRALREHGQSRKYHHDEVGWTARLDTIQAAVLSRKLPLLDGWNAERRAIAALYEDGLADVGDLTLPTAAPDSQPVWHVYVVRTADPTGLGSFLAERGIGTGRHYPEPPHLSRAYSSLGYREGAFPVAEATARECLSLPIFPGMSELQALRVVDAVGSWFARG